MGLLNFKVIFGQPRVPAYNRKQLKCENKRFEFSAETLPEAYWRTAAFLARADVVFRGSSHKRILRSIEVKDRQKLIFYSLKDFAEYAGVPHKDA